MSEANGNSRISLDDTDDGWIEFEYTNSETGERQMERVDLYEFSIALDESLRTAEEQGGNIMHARMAALRELLVSYGLPVATMSTRLIKRVCDQAMIRLNELKKKDGEAGILSPNAD